MPSSSSLFPPSSQTFAVWTLGAVWHGASIFFTSYFLWINGGNVGASGRVMTLLFLICLFSTPPLSQSSSRVSTSPSHRRLCLLTQPLLVPLPFFSSSYRVDIWYVELRSPCNWGVCKCCHVEAFSRNSVRLSFHYYDLQHDLYLCFCFVSVVTTLSHASSC